MTEQDRANIPAKSGEFRARNTKTGEITMLQNPELIRYFPDNILQKRNENGTWSAYELPVESPAENAHPEDVQEQTSPGA